MLDQSSLEELTIAYPTYSRIEHLEGFLTRHKPQKSFTFSSPYWITKALLPNITSLTCLKITGGSVDNTELNVLIKTVKSLPTLQVLEIEFVTYYGRNGRLMSVPSSLPQLIEAAGNSQLKELTIDANCFYLLPSDFKECYKHLLKCTEKMTR